MVRFKCTEYIALEMSAFVSAFESHISQMVFSSLAENTNMVEVIIKSIYRRSVEAV